MRQASSFVVMCVLAACGPRPKPIIFEPDDPMPADGDREAGPATTPPATGRGTTTAVGSPTASSAGSTEARAFAVPTLPMSLVLHHGTLVWADVAGAIWSMPADGTKPPRQLSEQHRDGLATHPFIAGDRVLAKSGKGLLAITVPGGAVERVTWTGVPALPETVIGDATTAFMTVFQNEQILRAPLAGGAARRVLDAKRAVLALRGSTLYVASYTSGTLLAVPVDGGAPRTIAAKLAGPTAIVVDDTYAYLYTELDRRVVRIALATGKLDVLGEHLSNSDEVAVGDDAIYTVSWPNKLVRLPKAPGAAPVTLADDLYQPRGVVHDDHWVYVTSDSPPRIVRVAVPPR